MTGKWDYIIIGASQAGLTAASTLRAHREEESILLINGEDRLPYKRTHLTKNIAAGFSRDDFALHSAEWYNENRIELINGYTVVDILKNKKSVLLDNGEIYYYGKLLIATGAAPMRPAVPGVEHMLQLRTAADTESIMNKLKTCRSVIILGQGVEGVELAEQCAKAGKEVLITGRSKRLMQRTLDEALSERLLKLFTENSISCSFKNPALSSENKNGRISLVCENRIVCADMIIASTGISPNNQLTLKLGINGERGIITNDYYETAASDIYAAGDVLQLPANWTGGLWHSAQHQGEDAAKNMAGIPTKREDYSVRTKCEVFGDFIFSMGLNRVSEADRITGWENGLFLDSENNYLKLFSRKGKVIAALMGGMKDSAKILERSLACGLSPEEITAALRMQSDSVI